MSKNSELLQDFTKYCQEHPELRFWQALRNWSGASFIHITPVGGQPKDTYYFEGKDA